MRGVVEGPPHKLLESVAEAVASDVVRAFPPVEAVRVRVQKPHVAVEGVVAGLGVEVFRERAEVL